MKKYIITIDTGSHESAYIVYNKNTKKLADKDYLHNVECIKNLSKYFASEEVDIFIIEQSQGMGMAAGMEVFMNLEMQGVFAQLAKQFHVKVKLTFRKTVKQVICGGSIGVKDSSISLMLREEWGEDNTVKIPNDFYWNEEVEANKGRKYMQNDLWQALALLYVYLKEPNCKQTELKKIDALYLDYLENG